MPGRPLLRAKWYCRRTKLASTAVSFEKAFTQLWIATTKAQWSQTMNSSSMLRSKPPGHEWWHHLQRCYSRSVRWRQRRAQTLCLKLTWAVQALIEYSSMPDKSLLNQLETSGEQHKDDKAHNGNSSGKSETTKISFIRSCRWGKGLHWKLHGVWYAGWTTCYTTGFLFAKRQPLPCQPKSFSIGSKCRWQNNKEFKKE